MPASLIKGRACPRWVALALARVLETEVTPACDSCSQSPSEHESSRLWAPCVSPVTHVDCVPFPGISSPGGATTSWWEQQSVLLWGACSSLWLFYWPSSLLQPPFMWIHTPGEAQFSPLSSRLPRPPRQRPCRPPRWIGASIFHWAKRALKIKLTSYKPLKTRSKIEFTSRPVGVTGGLFWAFWN